MHSRHINVTSSEPHPRKRIVANSTHESEKNVDRFGRIQNRIVKVRFDLFHFSKVRLSYSLPKKFGGGGGGG